MILEPKTSNVLRVQGRTTNKKTSKGDVYSTDFEGFRLGFTPSKPLGLCPKAPRTIWGPSGGRFGLWGLGFRIPL